MKQIFLFFISLIFLFSACKTPQGAQRGKLKNRSAEYIKKQLIQNQINAEWLSAKAKIKFRDQDRSMTVFSNLRIRKDSVIWMNAKAFGIEAGRILIRPDSIFVLNRLNKEYMAKDIWWLQDEFGLPVNFAGLQAMLLGNPVFFHSELSASKDSTNYILEGKNDKYEATYKVNGAAFRLAEMLIAQPKAQRVGTIRMENYKQVPETKTDFSYLRNINMQSPETGSASLEIEMSKVEVNEPFTIAFSIPPRYTKVH